MANITLNKAEIKKLIKGNDEKINETLSLFGTAVEKITSSEIEVEVAPNRPDILSQQGILRALKSYLGKKSKQHSVEKSGEKLIVEKSLLKEWPYAFACIVKGLKFNDTKIKEIIDIQEKLGTTLLRNRKKGGIGIYPLEKIRFPIRFVGMEPDKIKFRPLEYPSEITGRQILSKHPTGRDYAHICQNWEKFPVFIDNKGTIMSMPPIINSHDVGKITEKTKDVFMEATGTDANTLQKALIIIVIALADMGGKIYSIECEQQNGKKISIPNLSQEKLKINLDDCNKLLGLCLKEQEVKKLLEKMGYGYKNKTVEIPAYRTDILHPNDIYEDIAIAYGYDKFKPEIPNVPSIGKEDEKEVFYRKIREILIGLEMQETSSYHLLTKEDIKKSGNKKENLIEVENSKTDYKLLRENLRANSLKILSENIDAEYPQSIFEIGKVFEKHKEEVKEKTNLIISKIPSNFTELKQILQYLEQTLNIKLDIKETNNASFIEGRTGKILKNNKEIGIIGEIHPQVLKNFHLKMPLSVLEICIDDLV